MSQSHRRVRYQWEGAAWLFPLLLVASICAPLASVISAVQMIFNGRRCVGTTCLSMSVFYSLAKGFQRCDACIARCATSTCRPWVAKRKIGWNSKVQGLSVNDILEVNLRILLSESFMACRVRLP